MRYALLAAMQRRLKNCIACLMTRGNGHNPRDQEPKETRFGTEIKRSRYSHRRQVCPISSRRKANMRSKNPQIALFLIAVVLSSLGSFLWGLIFWDSSIYSFIQFLLPSIWLAFAAALVMSWREKRRWTLWLIVAVSVLPAMYYPAQMIAMSLFFAIQGFV